MSGTPSSMCRNVPEALGRARIFGNEGRVRKSGHVATRHAATSAEASASRQRPGHREESRAQKASGTTTEHGATWPCQVTGLVLCPAVHLGLARQVAHACHSALWEAEAGGS